MSGPTSNSTELTPVQQDLCDFIVSELASGEGVAPISADEDLIKRGIVDSLGVDAAGRLLRVALRVRVTDADLVPENFQTLRQLADYVEGKR